MDPRPSPRRLLALVAATALIAGCASPARLLMPTPLVYQGPGAPELFTATTTPSTDTQVDLFFITDRADETTPESTLPYGEQRGGRVAFGSAKVRMAPEIAWADLDQQSRLGERTQPVELKLGDTRELGAFPREPYRIQRLANGQVIREPTVVAEHEEAKNQFVAEMERRLAAAPTQDVILYVHGFNETFATAAYTAAELCHFLGREQVCAFFTWPASSSGNFLTAYTTTTESADYAVDHLRKAIRLISSVPGVERVHLLAHSRGTAVTLDAVYRLFIESIAAGREPVDSLRIGDIVLFSPDIDLDIATQRVTAYASDPDLITVWPEHRLPKGLHGNLTVYSSPEDRALLISKILFRSRNRVGQLTADDLTPQGQAFLANMGKISLITYQGERTDRFGHSYFTTNPEVSSDLIQMLRYGKALGEPGRQLRQTGPVTWEFPVETGQ